MTDAQRFTHYLARHWHHGPALLGLIGAPPDRRVEIRWGFLRTVTTAPVGGLTWGECCACFEEAERMVLSGEARAL